MLNRKLKFSQAKFEYFLLQITPDTELTDIRAKLIGFKQFNSSSVPVVLELYEANTCDDMQHIVSKTVNIAEELGLSIHAILKNNLLTLNSLCGIQVIDLPNVAIAEHIQNKSLICSEPVRSGMKIENDGDIIVTSFVSDNAELIASGNIHVYGEARGRLVAGNCGDKSACIFVAKFNAELISIGGVYRVIEDKLPDNIMHHAVMIQLNDKGRLLVNPM